MSSPSRQFQNQILPARLNDAGPATDEEADEESDIVTDEQADMVTDEEGDIVTDEEADMVTDEEADEESDIVTDEEADMVTDVEADETPEEHMEGSYQPTVADVLAVKGSLLKMLPHKLVDVIIDSAEYWPHTHVAVRQSLTGGMQKIFSRSNEDVLLLRSYPLGYIPRKNDPTDLPFETESYLTSSPNPEFDCDGCSEECMNKYVSQWAEESHFRRALPCRKIVFTIKSHDQGWGGEAYCAGTYKSSYTWFDVGKEEACVFEVMGQSSPGQSIVNTLSIAGAPEVETSSMCNPNFIVKPSLDSENEPSECTGAKTVVCTSRTISPTTDIGVITVYIPDIRLRTIRRFNHPLIPDSNALQRNVVAAQNVRKHVITWSFDDNIDPESTAGDNLDKMGRGRATANGEYVRSLRPGQIVTVWGKARFPGWVNYVEEVMLDIYWAV